MSAASEVKDGSVADDHSGEPVVAAGVRRSRVGALLGRIDRWLRRESLLVMLLIGSFLTRWLLADRNSYWYDELLSVNVYGRWHDSAFDALRHLAANSIHPPLYQFTLFQWMEWFGDSERATRTLSNLYVTLATLFVFLLVRNVFSRRLALASAALFALMYTPMYYALETRSYAQTMFLVTLSSYLLLRMMCVSAVKDWRSALLSPTFVLFMGANVALLLTHYYNFFFWTAQGLIAAVFVVRELRPRQWPVGVAAIIAMYGLQSAVFVLVWGRAFVRGLSRRGGDFEVEDGVQNPLHLLETVLTPNIDPPLVLTVAGVLLTVVLFARAGIAIAKRGDLTLERQRAWTVAYLVGWLILPLLVVYAAFEISGVARYSSRYWLFIVPALAPLIVLVIRVAVRIAGRAMRHRWGVGLHPFWTAATVIVVALTLILPGTLAAATASKADWRGLARQVVDIVETDRGSSYIIYETGWSRTPRSTYYFERFSDEIEPYDTLRQSDEDQGQFRVLTVDEPVVAQHDYLIVLFPHLTAQHFPDTLAALSERYEVRLRNLDRRGRGFVIFDVQPE
jgi:uncharacterized membrane protein